MMQTIEFLREQKPMMLSLGEESGVEERRAFLLHLSKQHYYYYYYYYYASTWDPSGEEVCALMHEGRRFLYCAFS
jgi:hypothetical protein